MGPGARPPSRSHTRTRSATRPVRPATSMGTRDDGQGSNGTVPQDSTWSTHLPQSRKRPSKSLPKKKAAQVPSSSKSSCSPIVEGEPSLAREREVSLIRSFNRMSLGAKSEEEQGNQANSLADASTTSSGPPQVIKTPRKGGNRVSFVPNYTTEETECSQVDPEARDAKDKLHNLESSIWALTPGRGRPPTSPTKPLFLHRHSNTYGFTVNDIDEKVVRMDTELAKIKSFMETTERSSASAKEELELAKKRCEHRIAADDTTFFDQAY